MTLMLVLMLVHPTRAAVGAEGRRRIQSQPHQGDEGGISKHGESTEVELEVRDDAQEVGFIIKGVLNKDP